MKCDAELALLLAMGCESHSTSEQQQAQLPSPEALEQRLGINDSVYEANNGASKISHSAQRQHCANGTLFMALP